MANGIDDLMDRAVAAERDHPPATGLGCLTGFLAKLFGARSFLEIGRVADLRQVVTGSPSNFRRLPASCFGIDEDDGAASQGGHRIASTRRKDARPEAGAT